MRVVVASPPKTGNVWIKSLLAEVYGLKVLDDPPTDDPRSLQAQVENGWFEQHSIFHQHFHPSPPLFKVLDSVGAQVVTTIRNPYDMFVSLFHYVNTFPELIPEGHPQHVLLDKPIDHADVLAYIAREQRGFGVILLLSVRWLDSGRSIVTRYEDLMADPAQELKRVTDEISPADEGAIVRAVEVCAAENMRGWNETFRRHVRKAEVGDWRNHLTEAQLEVFRANYSSQIRRMGYDVA